MRTLTLLLFCTLFLGTTFGFSGPPKRTPLKKGDKAPKIFLKDVYEKKVSIKKITKTHKILLVFLRHAWCPICNLRTHELIKNYDALKKKGYEVVAVYPSNSAILQEYAADYNLPFKVIADPNLELNTVYQLEHSAGKMAKTMMKSSQRKQMRTGKESYMNKDNSKYRAKKEMGCA
jgi:thioredoxin-dependent peroxiredoxin